MSNENIPDPAFFSWLDVHIEQADKRAGQLLFDDGQQFNDPQHTAIFAVALARLNALREVRAYFGGAS